jgi:ribose transport system permease protein
MMKQERLAPPLEGIGRTARARPGRGQRLQPRFLAIWIALILLLIAGGLVAPRSLLSGTLAAIIPFAAFLAIAAVGETLVLMTRGIDLSIPAIVTLSSTVLLGVSGGADADLGLAVVMALLLAAAAGLVNGLLVGFLELNALIVTLATGAMLSGATLWYRESLPPESSVPALLAAWGGSRILGVNLAAWVAVLLVALLTLILRKTPAGRRFSAVGANPRAAYILGIGVPRYRAGAFAIAGLLYGLVGILLSAFIRNPTLDVGNAYLLAPIAAAVLGGTAVSGGIGSLVSVAVAALFLTHLGQILKMLGLSTAIQMMVEGLAIALGMGLAGVRVPAWLRRLTPPPDVR